ncbi:MFS transporter [Luteipulveratus halotolerans]|uniref:MFS transporter n=1 Tax=Luteipulveratus halotolerans TaxID=1631356 RepID=A0A0L6CMG0_9MICO|nr:MFS transporter [Luteipulveratus halotolerans]KNX38924.1 MFS transporter [Luteipulveratus halotolerans]
MSTPTRQDVVPPDHRMVRSLAPLLGAAALGLVPFTVFSTFLVRIADDSGSGVDLIGSLRGLGGLAALAVGALAAPLVDRLSRPRVAAGALVVLAAGCALAVTGSTATWVLFCLLIGAGTALLNPALTALAADPYDGEAAAGRAATLVSSTTTLTAVLAAPVLAAPALWWGWQGDLVAAAVACTVVAAVIARRPGDAAGASESPSYGRAFRTVAAVPGAVPLIAISTIRTTCFMGQLAYAAAYFDERHRLTASTFTLVWTLSGVSFFVAGWWAGRRLSRSGNARPLLVAGAAIGGAGALVLFTAGGLILALAGVVAVAAGHAAVAASVVTLLVRRSGTVRGTALSLNASGQSLGVFAGAALVGGALHVGGWTTVGFALAGLMAVAVGLGVAR